MKKVSSDQQIPPFVCRTLFGLPPLGKHIGLLLICFFSLSQAFSWGFWAHQRINRLAVFTLPPEMVGLYKQNLDYLTEHAVDPDKRRYAVDGEAPKHFIDIDHYGTFPFANVPRNWDDAVAALTEDTLLAYGILPYQLPREFYKLKRAFEDKNLALILKYSADIGHYIGDAHVPLHTTENYNGQMTGQKGIHGFWESRLPELYGENYDFFVGRSYFIDDIYAEGWEAVLESHQALDSVLQMERMLTIEFPSDKKYSYESRNSYTLRVYSRDFARAYHEEMDGMVERRMRRAIRRIGSYWYTAWKAAGSPDLSELSGIELPVVEEQYEQRLNIVDREALGTQWLFAPSCCMHPPKGRPMGWKRTVACVPPPVAPMETAKAPWWKRLWKWLGAEVQELW
ncbi:MAG: zinc dependent phospholipase C family protein [Bacteroidota bacterium]